MRPRSGGRIRNRCGTGPRDGATARDRARRTSVSTTLDQRSVSDARGRRQMILDLVERVGRVHLWLFLSACLGMPQPGVSCLPRLALYRRAAQARRNAAEARAAAAARRRPCHVAMGSRRTRRRSSDGVAVRQARRARLRLCRLDDVDSPRTARAPDNEHPTWTYQSFTDAEQAGPPRDISLSGSVRKNGECGPSGKTRRP